MADHVTDPAKALPHYTLLEDIQGLALSILLCSLSLELLRSGGLVTGGTAGLALLLSYASGWSFGWMFFVINLPFYAFAWVRRGPVFAIKSFVTVTLVSFIADAMPGLLTIAEIKPWASALLFGVTAGFGMLGLFRHGSSLGGVSIVAVIVQDRFGIRAGWIQLGWDLCLLLVSLTVLPWQAVLWSLFGAAVLNLVIALNHRRDWYVAT